MNALFCEIKRDVLVKLKKLTVMDSETDQENTGHTSSVITDDAIRHVIVLSNQVDSQIDEENTGRVSSVISCCRLDAIHPVTVLSDQVDSQIVEENICRASSVISAAGSYLLLF
ncbi:hypothetical protein DAPPUDRAFT_229998 [Daphnia pulex]|uniref:Uncharacterized protein n=1 Tax=Daphnia pulex TaxID=6669 RepID=E9I152_DAPPU|nr:hypothetical protein DAPPUDRAFT_229998 [Daphnia pulex]|eukprot:EFX62279.1 hypothetical protein DAPPUDRAFT_229998 [Daphnia pulex]